MDVDDGLRLLGRWNKWQLTFYVLLSIANTFPASWHMLAIVFLGAQNEHHCLLPEGVTPNDTVPIAEDGAGWDKCHVYTDPSPRRSSNETEDCSDGWHYYGDAGRTIVSEWDLVCDNSYLVETTQTVMVVGVMCGAMFFSTMSDYIGRKPVFLFSEWAMVVVGVSTAFVKNYYIFAVLRFLAGALQQGIILTGFVMACELFPAENRTFAGMALENCWATGMCLLSLFAYLIRDWRYLQLVLSTPAVLTIAFFWILPESIPWLAANNRIEDAEEIIHQAAKFNNLHIPNHVLVTPEQAAAIQDEKLHKKQSGNNPGKIGAMIQRLKPKKQDDSKPDAEQVARYTLLDVVKHPKLRMYAIIMCMLWFVNSLVYYGLSLSTAALAGNRYLNFFLSGLVEIPAYTSCIFILQKWGRRRPLAVFHVVAGVALCISLIIPEKTSGGTSLQPLIMTFNMIGKFGITGSFGTVFLYAPEIFPTTLRNQAMGISSLGGRLGNMLAPFSSYVARIVPWLPGVLFGGLSIGVGLLVFLLPETLNKPLPQTIEDIENWSKKTPKSNRHELDTVGANDITKA